MTTEAPPADPNSLIAKYQPDEVRIAEVRAEFTELLAKLPELVAKEELAPLKDALKTIIPLRTEIERARVRFKANALEYGRKVDAEARRLTGLVRQFEDPIQVAVGQIEQIQRIRAEEKVREQEARERQLREAEEEAQRVLKEAARQVEEAERAEARRMLEIDRAELERVRIEQEHALAAIRAKFEEEEKQRNLQRLAEEAETKRQRAEVEAQAAQVRKELERIDREKREEEIRKQAAEDARLKAEKDAAERTQREEMRKRQEELDRKQAAEALPDVEKIHSFGAFLGDLAFPNVKSGTPAAVFMAAVMDEIGAIAGRCRAYTHQKKGGKP